MPRQLPISTVSSSRSRCLPTHGSPKGLASHFQIDPRLQQRQVRLGELELSVSHFQGVRQTCGETLLRQHQAVGRGAAVDVSDLRSLGLNLHVSQIAAQISLDLSLRIFEVQLGRHLVVPGLRSCRDSRKAGEKLPAQAEGERPLILKPYVREYGIQAAARPKVGPLSEDPRIESSLGDSRPRFSSPDLLA